MTTTTYREHFGAHLRSLRRARGLTQQALADRSGLSAHTVRRLEVGAFAASLDTLHKLSVGLELTLATMFESFEATSGVEPRREVMDVVRYCSDRELDLVLQVIRALLGTVRGCGGLTSATESVARFGCARAAANPDAADGCL